ncbi:MAG: hypothetical protein V3U90_06675 [Dehalococcoidia bacterium]
MKGSSGKVIRLVRHARGLVFHLAEVAIPQEMFEGVLERIVDSVSHQPSGCACTDEEGRWTQGEVCVSTR